MSTGLIIYENSLLSESQAMKYGDAYKNVKWSVEKYNNALKTKSELEKFNYLILLYSGKKLLQDILKYITFISVRLNLLVLLDNIIDIFTECKIDIDTMTNGMFEHSLMELMDFKASATITSKGMVLFVKGTTAVASQIFTSDYKYYIDPEYAFKNIGGFSCFSDSFLYPTLVDTKSPFIKHVINFNPYTANGSSCKDRKDRKDRKDVGLYLAQVKDIILRMYIAIRYTPRDSDLRTEFFKLFKECNDITENLLSGNQMDDSEFVHALFDLFDYTPTDTVEYSKIANKKFLPNDNDWIIRDRRQTPVVLIEALLDDYNPGENIVTYAQQELIQKHDEPFIHRDLPFNYNSEQTIVSDSECLIVHVHRLVPSDSDFSIDGRPVVFDEKIMLGDRVLVLKLVTCHTGSESGGHYTSFFNHNNEWYYYNDLGIDKGPRVKLTDWNSVQNIGSVKCSTLVYY